MTDIVSPLLEWLNAHPQLAGLVTFIISASESVAIIGTIVPGSIMMTALGTLAGAGVIPLWETIIWAILGAIVGDGISYWIGHYFKDRLPHVWPFRKYPNILKSGEVFFHKYGSMSVFIGRFVGPVRALVPLVAGMLGMKPWKFIIANVTSAIGWAPAYMLPGILLGAASLELPPDIAMHVILVLLIFGLFIMLCLWFLYKLLQLISYQSQYLQNQIWNKLKKSSYFSFITVWLKHGDIKKNHHQLTLAFYCFVVLLLFILLTLYVKIVGPSSIMVNEAMFHLFRGIRTGHADSYMIFITLLGQKQVILALVLILFAWLFYMRRPRAAFHLLGLMVLAGGSVFVLKHLIREDRPWGIFQIPSTFSTPSGHATLSMAIFLGIAFLASFHWRASRRWPIYFVSISLLVLVSISRLYLGAHWFTDVLCGWLLGLACLLIFIISYQRRIEKPIHSIKFLLVALISICLIVPTYYFAYSTKLSMAYAQVNWPTIEISMHDWWKKNNLIPARRASLFGFPSQQINIEWAGDINDIKTTLLEEGWSHPPARDFVSTVHRIADVSSAEYLPLISPQYLDKKPELLLTRNQPGSKGLLVIRLWNANRILKETNSPLWVGIVGTVPRSYSWLFQKNPGDVEVSPALIFPHKPISEKWQWKIMPISKQSGKKKVIVQKELFIRNLKE